MMVAIFYHVTTITELLFEGGDKAILNNLYHVLHQPERQKAQPSIIAVQHFRPRPKVLLVILPLLLLAGLPLSHANSGHSPEWCSGLGSPIVVFSNQFVTTFTACDYDSPTLAVTISWDDQNPNGPMTGYTAQASGCNPCTYQIPLSHAYPAIPGTTSYTMFISLVDTGGNLGTGSWTLIVDYYPPSSGNGGVLGGHSPPIA